MDTLQQLLEEIESEDFAFTAGELENEIMNYLSEGMPIFVSTHFRGLLSEETIAAIKKGITDAIISPKLDAWMVKHDADSFLVRKPFGSKCGIDFLLVYYDNTTIKFIRILCSSSKNDRMEWESLPVPKEHCLYIHHDTKKDLVYAAMGKQLCDPAIYDYFQYKEEEINRSLPYCGDWKVSFQHRVVGGPPFTRGMVTGAIETIFNKKRREVETKRPTTNAETKRPTTNAETKTDADREEKVPPKTPDIGKLDESRSRGGYTKAEMEAFCREFELPTSGNKNDLVERLLEYLGE